MKIMIVDDERIASEELYDICLSHPSIQEANVFNNPAEALYFISEHSDIDIAFLDIEMPVMDGHRLTKLVKGDSKLKDVPVVIFSSLVNDEMRRKGEQLGADAQLAKPEIGNLVREIDKLIMKSQK